MDSIIARVAATPQRRGGPFAWLGSPVFRVAAVAAVLVAAIVVGTQFGGLIGRPAGVDPSAESSQSVSPSAASPGPSATEVTSAPSATPEPSRAGSSDELVLRVKYGGGISFGPDVMPEFTLMADGTVVWLPIPSDGTPPTLLTRKLTPDGLADLREHIFASGFLDESATYELEPRPDAGEPPGRGIGIYTFTGGEPDPVVVSSVQWIGDEYEATYYQPSPEREALDTLAQQLRAPESLVGDDAWIDTAAAYEAADYQLVLRLMPDIPPYGTTDASEIPWPFDGALDEFGEQSGPVIEARCGIITAAEAAPIVEAIAASGIPARMDAVTIASLNWAEGNGVVDVFLIPRMPDGHAECTDLP